MALLNKPRTEAQRDAARVNGAKSRGPVTPEGMARCGMKPHLMPGMLIPGESDERYQELVDATMAGIQPANCRELTLVKIIIRAEWELQRMWDLHDATLRDEIERRRFDTVYTDDPGRAAEAWRRVWDQSGSFAFLLRHEVHCERRLASAMKELAKLRGGVLDFQPRFPFPTKINFQPGPDNSLTTKENDLGTPGGPEGGPEKVA